MKLSEIARRIVEIDEERSAIRDQEEKLKDERRTLEEQLLDAMADEGVDSVRTYGRTVYVRHETWASATDVATLKDYPDTAQFVKETVNGNTLSAYIRELPRDEENRVRIPPEIQDAVNVSYVTKVGTRKA